MVAAARAIEEYGPGVGTAQIAERAGVARPHVYRHFDSKEDLEREVLRFAADQLIDTVRPAGDIVRDAVAEAETLLSGLTAALARG